MELDLESLKALCDAATPGPWTVYGGTHKTHCVTGALATCPGWDIHTGEPVPDKANAEFIAAARNAVPTLVAEVETLRRLLGLMWDRYENGVSCHEITGSGEADGSYLGHAVDLGQEEQSAILATLLRNVAVPEVAEKETIPFSKGNESDPLRRLEEWRIGDPKSRDYALRFFGVVLTVAEDVVARVYLAYRPASLGPLPGHILYLGAEAGPATHAACVEAALNLWERLHKETT